MQQVWDGVIEEDADELFGSSKTPVTQADLDAWEQTHKVPIPQPFAQYLLRYNGSAFGLDTYVVQEDGEDSIERMLSVVHGKPNRVEDVIGGDHRPDGFFPVARGLGAVEFSIRLSDGAVCLIAYDGTEDEPREVAESFGMFLRSIAFESDEDEDDDWL